MPPVTQGKIAIFGAGGPVGAAAARSLRDHYTLRLTDVRPIAEIAADGKPQSPGAPLPEALPPPHECRVVDVSDYAQVLEADCGEAFRYGLQAPAPPNPYEVFFIAADAPHGKYRTDKAKRLLGWEARHRFERLWSRRAGS